MNQESTFRHKYAVEIKNILTKYPADNKQSAVMPLLTFIQEINNGWLDVAAIEEIASILDMSYLKVYGVASFYTMYNLSPVGKYVIEICRTTPCWLCSSNDILEAVQKELKIHLNETDKNGLFTLREVECLGACTNAPIIKLNNDYIENVTSEKIITIIRNIKEKEKGAING